MPAPTVRLRPGLLDRLKTMHRLPNDEALAKLIGVSRATLARVQSGEIAPSAAFMAGLVKFSGLGLGEAFEVVPSTKRERERVA